MKQQTKPHTDKLKRHFLMTPRYKFISHHYSSIELSGQNVLRFVRVVCTNSVVFLETEVLLTNEVAFLFSHELTKAK